MGLMCFSEVASKALGLTCFQYLMGLSFESFERGLLKLMYAVFNYNLSLPGEFRTTDIPTRRFYVSGLTKRAVCSDSSPTSFSIFESSLMVSSPRFLLNNGVSSSSHFSHCSLMTLFFLATFPESPSIS